MYKKVLSIQDISCVGQCSTTVALPVISACGIECAILPSAVLSTHTAGDFQKVGFTCADLTNEFPAIEQKWKALGIKFDAIYTGYLGTVEQIECVKSIMDSCLAKGGQRIVDPAMADGGKLYPAFGPEYVKAMGKLASTADYVLPNITEAAFLTGSEYKEKYTESYIESLLEKLVHMGCKNIILTGVSFSEETTGVVIYENGRAQYYRHRKIKTSYHGTGDIYSSAFAGLLMAGKSAFDSAKIAAEFTCAAIENTIGDDAHWYGVKFEPLLGALAKQAK